MRHQLFKLTIASLFATATVFGASAAGQTQHSRVAAAPRAIARANPEVEVTRVTLVEQDAKHSTFEVSFVWHSNSDLKPETVDIIAILIGLKSQKQARISLNANANGELPASARLTIQHVDGLLPYIEQDNIRVNVTVSVRARAGAARRVLTGKRETVFKVNRPS